MHDIHVSLECYVVHDIQVLLLVTMHSSQSTTYGFLNLKLNCVLDHDNAHYYLCVRSE